MSRTKKHVHTIDAEWMRTYSRLVDSQLLPYPSPQKRCFYCGGTGIIYVVEVVVDHLCSLDMRSKIPIQKTMKMVRSVVEDQGAEAISQARHLVSTCSDCHCKLVSIGWTL
jgi:5-methylcytosine-specific restriction endonuclease McrA